MLLQVSILDGPHRSLIFSETYNRRLWNQKRVRQMHGRDVDLGLFAQIEVVRQSIERDLHPALFVDAVALRLDPGNPPLKPLVREGPQHDLGRLPDLNFTRFALIDVGEHPDGFRIDQGENRLSCAKRGTKLLLARGHHGVVGRREGVKI